MFPDEQNTVYEKKLVEKLIAGNEDAFCELYAEYKNKLIYFAFQFVKSKEFAEDIFQDTFTHIWQSKKFIDPNKSFSSYLYTIIKNRILNELRSLESQSKLKVSLLDQAIDSDTPIEKIISDDITSLINKSLTFLTERQRQVFLMSRNQQLSHKQIAQKLNISTYTVQEHISNSLRTIRKYLSQFPHDILDIFLLLWCINI